MQPRWESMHPSDIDREHLDRCASGSMTGESLASRMTRASLVGSIRNSISGGGTETQDMVATAEEQFWGTLGMCRVAHLRG